MIPGAGRTRPPDVHYLAETADSFRVSRSRLTDLVVDSSPITPPVLAWDLPKPGMEWRRTQMANIKKTAARTLRRAKAAGVQAKRKGTKLAQELAKQPVVRKARKQAANASNKAAALASRLTDRVTGRAGTRKRAKVAAAAAAGAVVVAAAVGVGLARKRKR